MRDRSHVVMFSGGAASYAAAKYVAAKHGTERLWLFFTDTSMEDQDLYRFLHEAAADVGGTLEIYKDGRTPWEVFRETRFLGNTRVDPCSRILKREPARRWIRDTFKPDDVELYVGITWEEQHRLDRMKKACTLAAFRERVAAADQQLDLFDWGGCGCFLDESDEDAGE